MGQKVEYHYNGDSSDEVRVGFNKMVAQAFKDDVIEDAMVIGFGHGETSEGKKMMLAPVNVDRPWAVDEILQVCKMIPEYLLYKLGAVNKVYENTADGKKDGKKHYLCAEHLLETNPELFDALAVSNVILSSFIASAGNGFVLFKDDKEIAGRWNDAQTKYLKEHSSTEDYLDTLDDVFAKVNEAIEEIEDYKHRK